MTRKTLTAGKLSFKIPIESKLAILAEDDRITRFYSRV